MVRKISVNITELDFFRTYKPEQAIRSVVNLIFSELPMRKDYKQRAMETAITLLTNIRNSRGMKPREIRELALKIGVNENYMYTLRRKLMDLGIIEKIEGRYILSAKFSQYLVALADMWELVRRTA